MFQVKAAKICIYIGCLDLYVQLSFIIEFGRRHRRPSFLEFKKYFLFLLIIIIFLSPRLQRQFTSNLLQTSAQWSLGIRLPD